MSNQFSSDEEMLARLVREAGDPSVSPDPQYAETLRATILDRVGLAETVAHRTGTVREADVSPIITVERTRQMKRIAKLAVAATILMAIGILVFWMTIGGGSTNIALANVADALDSLRSATYDATMEIKDPMNRTTTTINMTGMFLAPSSERIEMSVSMGSAKDKGSSIMIIDHQAEKSIVLSPEMKMAIEMDMSKIKKPAGASTDMFEFVRRLVREGSSGEGEKAESLGKKEIDGRGAVGFRVHSNMADMTLWADPHTARPVRVDMQMSSPEGHGVMNNFRYDIELDPSLFSLEPPAGYTSQKKAVTMPVEEDLVNILRLIAEHNDGTLPPTIGANKEYIQAVQAETKLETEKLIKTPAAQKLMEKLKAQYGKDKQGFMKAWMKEWMKMILPITQKHTQGLMFYNMLQPGNDLYYAGKDVKLGAPDRPILWYKPTGNDKYRVIYADLSVKEMTPDDVKNLPKAKAQ